MNKDSGNYAVTCNCGRTMTVRAGDAGAVKPCLCGNDLAIPSLGVLRQSPVTEAAAKSDQSKTGTFVFFAVVAWIALIGTVFPGPYNLLAGFAIICSARIWFALLILAHLTPGNALLVLLVPLMPTVFFFKRRDIAWKPFVFGLLGYYLMFNGMAAAR